MSYLIYQPRKGATPDARIVEAVRAHFHKVGCFPKEVLVNPADHAAFGADETTGGILVLPRTHVAPGLVYVGVPDPPREVSSR